MSPRTLVAALLGLLTLGWLAVWSSAGWAGEGSKQLGHIVVGLFFLAGASRLRPYQLRMVARPFFVAASLALALVLVPGVGQTVNGSQRWLSLGPLGSWQPSEFAKLSLIFVLARIYQQRSGYGAFLQAGAATAVLFLLIAKQPDLGTAMVLGSIFYGMSWIAGAPAVPMLLLVGLGGAVAPFVLHDYQKARLLIFMHPETDPRGLGYHITQSQLAIGSGGWVGQGLGCGHLSQHGFVPENWTDFVFSVIGEEFGLLGGLGLLLLGSILGAQLLAITWRCKDRFDALSCGGVCTLLGFQALVNLSMTVGMAPVVGIPLPFCTYGGSAMLVNLAAVGLVLGARRADEVAPKLKELLDQTEADSERD
jgi:rod shape determining protein RodA